jgi:hypothetical protein
MKHVVGWDFTIWHKAVHIKFLKPGRAKVKAMFYILQERIGKVPRSAEAGQIMGPTFEKDVLKKQG